ncbi:MAG: 4-hydroxythreonine-4-phosphate dehydrogenase PdxA [Pseudomonadota bacterium]
MSSSPNPCPSPLIAMTMGDPAGIGPDLTLEAWQHSQAHQLPPFAVIADPQVLKDRARLLSKPIPLQVVSSMDAARDVFSSALPVYPLSLPKSVTAGQPDAINAPGVIYAIETAVHAVLKSQADAIVTNPIAKGVLYEAGFTHPGHTEFLAHLAEQASPKATIPAPVMMLASQELKTVPLTIHIPLADVAASISTALITQTIQTVHAALRNDFGIGAPRIAIAGLNPHAGENGTIGREDIEIIAPAIADLTAKGLDVVGPLSADTMFHEAARKTYDTAVCMFHDQALIPIKTLAFDRGVNVTLGLPFVRTSPDHGTAFSIAGTGKASATSLIGAVKLAAEMATARRAFRQDT